MSDEQKRKGRTMIQRAWKKIKKEKKTDGTLNDGFVLEEWKEIDEDRAGRDLAKAHGDNAVAKLKKEGKLETRFAQYRVVS